MSDDSSEEKSLPASQRKLRKAREKGQVVTSREAVMSMTGIAGLGYVYAMRGPIGERLALLFTLEPAGTQGFAEAMESKVAILWQLGLEIVAPLFGIVIAVSILGGLLVSGGPVFATESLKPTFDKVNPASGFKKVLGRRALMSFLMNVIRLTVLLGAFGLILVMAWGAMLRAPICGLGCAAESMDVVLLPLVAGGIAIMLVAAGFDYLVQRSEFLREQKMTLTEFKREIKDMQGDPHIKSQQRRDRRDMVQNPTGAGQATLVVRGRAGLAVGLRYREGETPAPLVVAKAKSAEAARRLLAASKAHAEADDGLAEILAGTEVGGFVTDDETIMRLAPMLQRAGVS